MSAGAGSYAAAYPLTGTRRVISPLSHAGSALASASAPADQCRWLALTEPNTTLFSRTSERLSAPASTETSATSAK